MAYFDSVLTCVGSTTGTGLLEVVGLKTDVGVTALETLVGSVLTGAGRAIG